MGTLPFFSFSFFLFFKMKEKFITIPLPFLNVNIRGQVWERNRVEIPSGEEHGYYNDSSSSTSIRILALHGWLDNSSTFARIAPYICERFPNTMSVHLTAVDFLGHGLSDHLAKETIDPYNFPSRIIEVSLILKELEWESCYILGHSLGGAVAASGKFTLYSEFSSEFYLLIFFFFFKKNFTFYQPNCKIKKFIND